MKHIDLIKQTKDVIDGIKAPFISKKAEKGLEMQILEVQEKVASADVTIQEEKSEKSPDWDKIINAIDQKELLERKLRQLEAVKEELF